eukprot:13507105-Heterocapsa_arctica.AAC.1
MRSPGMPPSKQPLFDSTPHDEPFAQGPPRKMPLEIIARRHHQPARPVVVDGLFLQRGRVTPWMGGYILAAPKLVRFAATRQFDLRDQQRRDYTVT